MLRRVYLLNFKPFRSFKVSLSNFDVLVGKNNMGKSSLVDAIRLLAEEANYRLRRSIGPLPRRILGQEVVGCWIPTDRIPFPIANLRYEYKDVDTSIVANFDNGLEIRIVFLRPPLGGNYLLVRRHGDFLESAYSIRKGLMEIRMAVLPPLTPFEETEGVLSKKYVAEVFGTRLSSRHFRNIWLHDDSEFDEFREMLVETWPGADVSRPESSLDMATGDRDLAMYFTENRISREIAWAGHGMQVWMQILTYLAKMRDYDTLVLDEPEIYQHSDVQRKLVHLVRSRASQIIIATHSVDIVNEAAPGDVILVDKKQSNGRRLESLQQVQSVVERLGSVQNIQLLTVLRSRYVLFVEGRERRILQRFSSIIGVGRDFDSPRISVVPLDGEANWKQLKSLNWVWRNTLGQRIRSYVILDSDYRTEAEITDTVGSLRKAGVGAHIWAKKEIENYLLVPRAIAACIEERFQTRGRKAPRVREHDVQSKILELADSYQNLVRSQLLANILEEMSHTGEDKSTTISRFSEEFDVNWRIPDYRLSRAPGKALISDLSRWSQSAFGVSLSSSSIAESLADHEVQNEVKDTIMEVITRATRQ